MDAALVKLVDDDGPQVLHERILLKPRGEDAFGRHDQPRRVCEIAIEPHVPTDLAPERPRLFVGDPPRDRPRRDPARL